MLVKDALTRIAGLSFGEDLDGWHAAIRSVLRLSCRKLDQERSLARLPFYSAQAAGCSPEQAIPVAAAWLLGYVSARLFDAVEDQDFEPGAWEGLSSAQAINLAGAFLAASSMPLDDLEDPRLSAELKADFQRVALQMFAGQHADLSNWIGDGEGAIERYWQVAAAKSGSLFALACRAGARLANPPAEILSAYSDFGQVVGQHIQACDDFRDIYDPENLSDLQLGRVSLPIIYGRTVARPPERARLEQLLFRATGDLQAAGQLRKMLDDLGARHYLLIQMELLGQQAQDALRRTMATGPARERLEEWIPCIV